LRPRRGTCHKIVTAAAAVQAAAGVARKSSNDPQWLARRYGIDQGTERIVGAMADALAAIAQEATTGSPP
jgi:hypothetical protein